MSLAAIRGLSQVSAAGAGMEALGAALRGARPAPDWIACDPAHAEARTPVLLARAGGFDTLAEPGTLRRLDAFALKTLLAATLAIRDAGEDAPHARCGLIVATGHGPMQTAFGFLDQLIDKGDHRGSPVLFTGSLHNAPAAVLSMILGLRGPMLTLTGFQHSFSCAMSAAIAWLDAALADRVLLVAADEFHPVLGHGLQALGHCASDGRTRPFAFDKPSVVPGESFVAFVLERAGAAPAPWGLVRLPRPVRGALPVQVGFEAQAPLLVAAHGDPHQAQGYASILPAGAPVAAYTPLWGANPTSESMTLAAAAWSLSQQELVASPEEDALPVGVHGVEPGPAALPLIHCCTMNASGCGMLLSIERRG